MHSLVIDLPKQVVRKHKKVIDRLIQLARFTNMYNEGWAKDRAHVGLELDVSLCL